MVENAVKITDVVKNYASLRAVDSLNFEVRRGKIYGLLGPNGAGKTTLIRMIMNIISPDEGNISILGRPAQEIAKNIVGYMPEERGLYRKMTVFSLLRYIGSIKGADSGRLIDNINLWLKKIELEDKKNKRIEELSKGMQQKIQFLAAIISDPEIMILDEPFSGLDPVNLDLIKSLLIEMKNNGKTLIISTHMMDQAEQLCDFIFLINKGKRIFDGTLEEIQAGFPMDSVLLEIDKDASFLADLAPVRQVVRHNKELEILFKEGVNPQDLLKLIIDKATIKKFEIKKPTLHEIFIKTVGTSDEKNN